MWLLHSVDRKRHVRCTSVRAYLYVSLNSRPTPYGFNRFEDAFAARGAAFNGKRNKSVKGRQSECASNTTNWYQTCRLAVTFKGICAHLHRLVYVDYVVLHDP